MWQIQITLNATKWSVDPDGEMLYCDEIATEYS